MKRRASSWLAVLCACVLSVQASGCFGSFALTQRIYNFNRGVGDKFIQWIVFLAFTIIPVYGLGVFVDVWILNTIEFWTGGNPMASAETPEGDTRIVHLSPTETLRMSRDAQNGLMRMELRREGEEPLVRYFEPLEDGIAVRDEAGALLLRGQQGADGSLVLESASGDTVSVHSRESLEAARQALLQDGPEALAKYAVRQSSSPVTQGLALCAAR